MIEKMEPYRKQSRFTKVSSQRYNLSFNSITLQFNDYMYGLEFKNELWGYYVHICSVDVLNKFSALCTFHKWQETSYQYTGHSSPPGIREQLHRWMVHLNAMVPQLSKIQYTIQSLETISQLKWATPFSWQHTIFYTLKSLGSRKAASLYTWSSGANKAYNAVFNNIHEPRCSLCFGSNVKPEFNSSKKNANSPFCLSRNDGIDDSESSDTISQARTQFSWLQHFRF